LVFNHKYVDEDSEGWRTLKRALTELGVSDCGYLGLEEDFNDLMRETGFSRYEVDVLEEVVGEADRDVESGPIFPYPNEPMQKVLVRGWK